MTKFPPSKVPSKQFLETVKPGDMVVITRGVHTVGRIRIVKISRLTQTQVVVSDVEKYLRADGSRVGGLGGHIARIATAADLAQEEEQRKKVEAANAAIQADYDKRRELEGLFPAELTPGVSSGLAGQTYELSFHQLTENQIRELATLLKRKS